MSLTAVQHPFLSDAELDARRFKMVLFGIFVIFLSIVPFQRLGIQVGSGDTDTSEFPVSLPLSYFSLIFFWLSGRVYINLVRLGLCLVAMSALFLTLIIDPKPFSILSILFIFACYAPFVFVCPVSEDEYKRVLELFLTFMLVVAIIVFLQFAMYMGGATRTNLFEMIVPKQWLIQGYNNNARLSYELALQRPNGEVFLEPSICSQFLAVAAMIEMVWFRRNWRMAVYAGAVIATLSGTGTLLLIFVVGVIAMQKRQFHWIILGAVVYVFFKSMPQDSIFGYFASRADEFDAEGSSGYMRFIGPFLAIPYFLADNATGWLVGLGPGMVSHLYVEGDMSFNAFAFSKLMIEYGLVGTIPFMTFLTYLFFAQKFNLTAMMGCFFMYNLLSGSLQQPPTIFLFFALAIFFVPLEERPMVSQ